MGLHASNFSCNYPISLSIEAKKASLITFDEVEARTVRSDTSKNQEIVTTMAKKTAPKAKAPAPAPAPKAAPASAVKARAATKGEIYGTISEKTGLGKKDVSKVFDALSELIAKELGKKGPGQFVVPGLLKLKVSRKEATKAKPGINPFTKEPITIKAKPARNVVKVVPMKALKEMV
ncbi:nucleoid DNA-binding protein [Singulisphaera sp. GP187]|nr:nucleoid DNA-binding protein [Singulisphaera sp. GP187]